MSMRRLWLALLGSTSLFGPAVGCAVQSKSSDTPVYSSERPTALDEEEAAVDPNDLEGLERLLALAEGAFGAELRVAQQAVARGDVEPWAMPPGDAAAKATATAPSGVGEEPGPPPTYAQAPAAGAGPSPAEAEAARQSTGGSDRASACGAACRALGSMQRAAAGICRITGDAHERCSQASARVDGAGERLRRAGCTCTVP